MFRRFFLVLLALIVMTPPALAQVVLGPAGLFFAATLPESAQPDGGEALDDGSYTQPYLIDGGMAVVVMAYRAADVTAEALLKELYPGAREVAEAEQAPVAAHPARRLTFLTGENEDARQCTLVAFPSDSGTFAFSVEIPVDFYGEYQEAAESWIASLKLLDCC
jgi:hypothetical protein